MNKKMWILLLLTFLCIFGCSSNKDDNWTNSINSNKYNTKNLNVIHCSRKTETEDDSEVKIQYKVYYNDEGYIEILKSYEVVTSSNNQILQKYKEAYKNIYSVYDDLEYYDHELREEDQKVISTAYINYGKIDIEKLMEIEGKEDNVKVTDGKIKLEDWKSFAKKYGTQCSSSK